MAGLLLRCPSGLRVSNSGFVGEQKGHRTKQAASSNRSLNWRTLEIGKHGWSFWAHEVSRCRKGLLQALMLRGEGKEEAEEGQEKEKKGTPLFTKRAAGARRPFGSSARGERTASQQ